jgi:acetyltransferase-like isoleucine patch superfamily enzyme
MIKKIRDFIWKRKDPIGYARKIGVTVGEKCRFIGSPDWGSEPWLISIGNHTETSCHVVFITHDGATWCFRDTDEYKGVIKYGRIRIGDNCFIGAHSMILPGVTIGNNSIVAAGSIVTKSIPTGEVWGGVPAKYIMKTKEYADKCKANTPKYDVQNYKVNFREEVERICDKMEQNR